MLEAPTQLRVAGQDESGTPKRHSHADPIKSRSVTPFASRQDNLLNRIQAVDNSLHEILMNDEKVIKIRRGHLSGPPRSSRPSTLFYDQLLDKSNRESQVTGGKTSICSQNRGADEKGEGHLTPAEDAILGGLLTLEQKRRSAARLPLPANRVWEILSEKDGSLNLVPGYFTLVGQGSALTGSAKAARMAGNPFSPHPPTSRQQRSGGSLQQELNSAG